jgi:hypothetical protein
MISQRSLELATAALTGTFGLAVVVSSIDNGIGWSAAGVDAGTFPFLIGLTILFGSLFNLVRGILHRHEITVTWSNLLRLAMLFVPAAVYIGVIPLIGMYLASGIYMFASLMLRDRKSLLKPLVISTVTPLALYLVFDRLFLVSLPHGALGDMLGF